MQQSGIAKIKKALLENDEYVVLVTPYKSCLDFFVVIYTLISHGLPVPYVLGHESDAIPSMLRNLISGSGLIYANRSPEQTLLSSYVT